MLRPLRLLVPFLLALVATAFAVADQPAEDSASYSPGTGRSGRVVLVIVDSLTDRLAEDPEAFPALAALRPRALWGRMEGCLPASTVACTRTLLEGTGAGYAAGLSNFSAKRAAAASWPVVAAREGMRIAVASDHTLVNMCEGLGGPRLHYSAEKVPPLHWDEVAVERASDWIRNDTADALLIHLVDLDKASHAAGPGTDRYREEVRGADRAIAAIAALLTPQDSLIVVGDHGHDEFGSHTPNPGYLAIGPAFSAGRLDLRQATTALLLSAAAGTPLPRSYEGEVPEQGLRTPFGGTEGSRSVIAGQVSAQREGHRSGVRARVWRFMPGLALALLALVAFVVERGRRLHAAAAALLALALAWGLGSVWASHARPLLWQGPARNVLHHGGLVVAFVALTTIVLGRVSSLSRAARVGIGLLAFPLAVPMVGDDYFSSPTSLARLFVPALALLVHTELAARSRWALAALGAAAAAAALLLAPVPNGAGWLPSVAAGLLGALLIARCVEPARRARAFVPAAVALVALAAPMDFGARATLALALLAAATACIARSAGKWVPAAVSIVGASAIFLAYWGSLGSLRFDKIRFDFVFDFVPANGNDVAVALLATVLTSVKYAILPWVVVSAAPVLANAKNGPRVVGWLFLSAFLHAAWVAGAALDPASRYFEAGMQAACLVAALAVLSVGAIALRRYRDPKGATASAG